MILRYLWKNEKMSSSYMIMSIPWIPLRNVDMLDYNFLCAQTWSWSFPIYTLYVSLTFTKSKVKMGGGEENLFNLLPSFPLLLVDKFYFELYLILFCLFRNPNIWLFCLSLIFNPSLSNVLSLMTTKYITFIELLALYIRDVENGDATWVGAIFSIVALGKQ